MWNMKTSVTHAKKRYINKSLDSYLLPTYVYKWSDKQEKILKIEDKMEK